MPRSPLDVHTRMTHDPAEMMNHWAQVVLEDFVDRFDQSCALLARQDWLELGRWSRAFSNVALDQHLKMTPHEYELLAEAVAYAYAHHPSLLDTLESWHHDWERILSEQERLSQEQIMELKWEATWHRQLREFLPSSSDQLFMYGHLQS